MLPFLSAEITQKVSKRARDVRHFCKLPFPLRGGMETSGKCKDLLRQPLTTHCDLSSVKIRPGRTEQYDIFEAAMLRYWECKLAEC